MFFVTILIFIKTETILHPSEYTHYKTVLYYTEPYKHFIGNEIEKSWNVSDLEFHNSEIEIKQEYNPNYIPNEKKISQYLLEYITQLRTINNLETTNLILTEDAYLYAESRTHELSKIGELTHETSNTITNKGYNRVSEVLMQGIYNFPIYSDRERAYWELLNYLSEYQNIEPGYGHAITLLDVNNSEFGYSITNDFSAMTFTDLDGLLESNNTFEEKLNEQNEYELHGNGNKIIFLPKIKFIYEDKIPE